MGGEHTDANGLVVEELLDERELVCLNDGRGTRLDVRTGKESVFDLTLVSAGIGGKCSWEVWKESWVGSNHYPVITTIDIEVGEQAADGKADWNKLQEISNRNLIDLDKDQSVDRLNDAICGGILGAALQAIPRSKGVMKRKTVPWWSEDCSRMVRDHNRAFTQLKRIHSYEHLVGFKRAQALVR